MVQRESGRAGRGETFAYFQLVATSVSINHGGNAGFSQYQRTNGGSDRRH